MYTFDLFTEQETKKRIFEKTHLELIKTKKNDSNSILFPEIETNIEERIQHLFNIHIALIEYPEKSIYEFLKRLLDISFCILLIPFAFIIISIFGLLIKLDSRGPIFYTQLRSGRKGALFTIIKLRSMVSDAEKECGATWATKNDPRITTMGKIIRKTRIDELPQIWNILKGDMSFIGPRPERPELILEFSEKHPFFITRNAIRPGITGWAQVNGGYELSPKEKMTYDLYYVKNRSILLDIYILFRTLGVVFTGNGAY
jgi:lipopolysaccharide/colanic/teichoic acid biosynthesis glycosyltransferase